MKTIGEMRRETRLPVVVANHNGVISTFGVGFCHFVAGYF